MKILDSVTLSEEITVVHLRNCPVGIEFVDAVFRYLEKADVNVDMICHTTTQKNETALSFTLPDSQLDAAMALLSELRKQYPSITSAISSSNSKITVSGDAMKEMSGIASRVFHAAAKAGVSLLLITTSETDISLLIAKGNEDLAKDCICKAFEK